MLSLDLLEEKLKSPTLHLGLRAYIKIFTKDPNNVLFLDILTKIEENKWSPNYSKSIFPP